MLRSTRQRRPILISSSIATPISSLGCLFSSLRQAD